MGKKIAEILKNKIEELKLEQNDFKDVFDGLLDKESKIVDSEKEIKKLKVDLDDANKKLEDYDKLVEDNKAKDKEINDLKIKYIDRFENEKERKEDEEKKGTTINSVDDLFEKGEK